YSSHATVHLSPLPSVSLFFFLMTRPPPRSPLFPYTTLFRSVLAPAWTLPLLRFMPEISESVALPLGHGELGWAIRRSIGRDLRPRSYDLALVLPGSLKSALVPYWAGIPARRGYGGAPRPFVVARGHATPLLAPAARD